MLKVENISFGYQRNTFLKDLSFHVNAGEHISIIGESGSGKSTLLKLLYGEYDLNSGSIFWKNTQILGPSHNLVIDYPFIKYVAQEFDLMPYISVAENIGKFLSNFYPEEKQNRVNALIEVVELTEFANTKVQYLSGGQKQRVAIARAIALQPEILILDEPFSHIDNFKKHSLRRSLFSYLKNNNIACIVATHDKNDVLPFADNMLVLHDGSLMAQGTPEQLYKNPQSPLIASFFGEYNIIEPYGIVYAHNITVTNNSQLKATVLKSFYNGNYYLIEALLNNNTIFFKSLNQYKAGDIVSIAIKEQRL